MATRKRNLSITILAVWRSVLNVLPWPWWCILLSYKWSRCTATSRRTHLTPPTLHLLASFTESPNHLGDSVLFCFVCLSFCGVNVFFTTAPTSPLCHPSHNHGNGHATVLGKHHYACTMRERDLAAKIGVSKPVSICDLMSAALQSWATLDLLLWPGGGSVFW